MTNYVLTDEEGAPALYPYDLARLPLDRPDLTFSDPPTEDELAGANIFAVTKVASPKGSLTRRVEALPPEREAGIWREAWAITNTPVADAAAQLGETLKARRDSCIDQGFTVAGIGTFDSDEKSRANITGATVLATIAQSQGQPFVMSWKLQDNTVKVLTGAQMIAVGIAAGQRVAACHARAQQLGAAIEAANTPEQIDAIDINAGWPG